MQQGRVIRSGSINPPKRKPDSSLSGLRRPTRLDPRANAASQLSNMMNAGHQLGLDTRPGAGGCVGSDGPARSAAVGVHIRSAGAQRHGCVRPSPPRSPAPHPPLATTIPICLTQPEPSRCRCATPAAVMQPLPDEESRRGAYIKQPQKTASSDPFRLPWSSFTLRTTRNACRSLQSRRPST